MISCEPEDLVAVSSCYICIDGNNVEAVKIYLLAVTAGLQGYTAEQLIAAAKCYKCIPKSMEKSVQNFLLCQIANA